MKRTFLSGALAVCLLTLTTGAARANTIHTFDVSGTFETYEVFTNMSGTATVDVTAGAFVSVNFLVSGYLPFTNIGFSAPFISPFFWHLRVFDSSAAAYQLDMLIELPPPYGSLIGYAGGIFTNGTILSPSNINRITCGLEGEVCSGDGIFSPQSAVTPVPVPAALPLFGSALAAMGIFRWWRRRKTVLA
jgi:hypothetical protein